MSAPWRAARNVFTAGSLISPRGRQEKLPRGFFIWAAGHSVTHGFLGLKQEGAFS